MNIYETLKSLSESQQMLRTVGKIGVTLPHKNDADRTVKDIFDRGGSMWGVKVAADKPEIYLCCRDNKTHDAETDSFDWTSIVVSVFRTSRFELVNNPFEARLTRELYDKLVTAGVCRPEADLSKPVLVDFRNLPSFPRQNFDENYIEDKISLLGMQARLKDLRYLKSQAAEYARKNNLSWAPEKQTRVARPEYVTVGIPTTSYTVTVEGLPEIVSGVDSTLYRTKQGRSYVYTEEAYNALVNEIEALKPLYKELGQKVRVVELSALEHYGWNDKVDVGQYKVIQNLAPTIEEKRCSVEDAARFIERHPHAFITKQAVVSLENTNV